MFFWPQGNGDYSYMKSLKGSENIKVIGANVQSLDKLLEDETFKLDYIGTRLHGGIRALQKSRRSIIIGIDNRAAEKANDFNLKVLSREHLTSLHALIQNDFETTIRLDEKNIQRWKNQFQ